MPVSPQSTIQTRNPVQYNKDSEIRNSASTLVSQNFEKEDNLTETFIDSFNQYRSLFFLPSELIMSQIVDNPKIQKPITMKFEPKALTFINSKFFKVENFFKISKDECNKIIDIIKQNTTVPAEKTAGAIKQKLHLLNYIGTLCSESDKLADLFVQAELYKDLLSIIKNGHNLEMKMKAARIFGLVFNKAKSLNTSKELTEVNFNQLKIFLN